MKTTRLMEETERVIARSADIDRRRTAWTRLHAAGYVDAAELAAERSRIDQLEADLEADCEQLTRTVEAWETLVAAYCHWGEKQLETDNTDDAWRE